jgi:hypothetical protein
MAMTNEERFIASCESVGEADVRQKLAGSQYSERRAQWASNWLEQLENGKSDATKAEESSSRLRKAAKPNGFVRFAIAAILFVMLLAGATAFLKTR